MRWLWVAGLAAVLLAAVAFGDVLRPGSASSTGTAKDSRGITVTGNGTVNTVPDRAEFSFGVHTESATAAAALGANGALMTKVIDAIEKADVPKADIQTSQVSLSPQTTPDGTTIVGYIAANSISVRSKIDRAGKLIDTAVAAGATGVSGPSLSLSDQDSLYRDALKKAVADAKLKAQALADAAGLTLGAAQSIAEGSFAVPLPIADRLAAPSATPIEPGTQDVQATVTVTYAAS